MKIDIITLFPKMFVGPFDESIINRAKTRGIVEINTHQLRDFTKDKHHTTDDRPYGGGTGMVLLVEPVYEALKNVKSQNSNLNSHVILMTPQGVPFSQKKAQELSKKEHIIFIAGRYEGYDERIREHLVDEEISIGDYVLTGGELPAMVVIDATVRLMPGVLEKEDATVYESFSENTLEYPQYTRPEEFNGWKVPEVLLSGHHGEVAKWRKEKSLQKTKDRRPDLLDDKH